MTKFAATSIADLCTPAATAGRLARKAKFVVMVECDDGSWCELDADDQGHAGTLARNFVDKQNARGASCRRVDTRTGELHPKSFYHYYAIAEFND